MIAGTTVVDDGTSIAWERLGGGAPLVLLHGITESRLSWGAVADDLAEDHDLLLVDLRGHGVSADGPTWTLERLADDVAAVLGATGLERPVVVGHSLGGFVATVLAGRHEVRGVVNVDQVLALAAFKDALSPVEEALRGEAFAGVIGQMFDGFMAPLPEEERSRLSALRRPNQPAVLGIWEPVFSQTVAELDALVRGLLAEVSAPYLSLFGEDPGEEYRAWLAQVLPQAEVEVWAGSAHYPHLMAPARFTARVREVVAAAT